MKTPRQLSLFRSSPGAVKSVNVSASVVAHDVVAGPVGITLDRPSPIRTGRLSDQGLGLLRADFFDSLDLFCAIDAPDVVPSGGVQFFSLSDGRFPRMSQVAFREALS